MAFKCRTDRVTRAHVHFCVKFMAFPYIEGCSNVPFPDEMCGK